VTLVVALNWPTGPCDVFTLFDGGLHRAQSAVVTASYDEQVANYRASVLTAFQEVEDNLAALRQLERENRSQAAAVAETQGAFNQANFRYQSGLVTYLEVVLTENAAFSSHHGDRYQYSAPYDQRLANKRLSAGTGTVWHLGRNILWSRAIPSNGRLRGVDHDLHRHSAWPVEYACFDSGAVPWRAVVGPQGLELL
jgi:hypothetical protein